MWAETRSGQSQNHATLQVSLMKCPLLPPWETGPCSLLAQPCTLGVIATCLPCPILHIFGVQAISQTVTLSYKINCNQIVSNLKNVHLISFYNHSLRSICPDGYQYAQELHIQGSPLKNHFQFFRH